MKVRKTGGRAEEKVELMMTPMIDIVFQLLIFFIMTFKIVSPEGDFNIKMPLAAPAQGPPEPEQFPPMKVKLTARPNGERAGIYFGNRPLANFQELRREVRGMIGDNPGPSVLETTEVELDCDYNLRYSNVVEAITAVSGYVDPKTGQIKKIIEKIKFAPPHK